jgi:hypothetical protein
MIGGAAKTSAAEKVGGVFAGKSVLRESGCRGDEEKQR